MTGSWLRVHLASLMLVTATTITRYTVTRITNVSFPSFPLSIVTLFNYCLLSSSVRLVVLIYISHIRVTNRVCRRKKKIYFKHNGYVQRGSTIVPADIQHHHPRPRLSFGLNGILGATIDEGTTTEAAVISPITRRENTADVTGPLCLTTQLLINANL